MSETPGGATSPPPGGSPAPPQPEPGRLAGFAAEPEAVPGTEPRAGPAAEPATDPAAGPAAEPAPARTPAARKSAERPRRLPAGWGAWLLVLAVSVAHLAVAAQTALAGDLIPSVNDLRGEDLFAWVETLIALFVRLDAAWDTSRLLALWILVLMVTSIYTSQRAGASVPQGVVAFIGYALTSVILVGVATPAAWYVFGDWGPVAALFVPPVAMTVVAALSLRSVEN
mgnify:CR=1 FL=1